MAVCQIVLSKDMPVIKMYSHGGLSEDTAENRSSYPSAPPYGSVTGLT